MFRSDRKYAGAAHLGQPSLHALLFHFSLTSSLGSEADKLICSDAVCALGLEARPIRRHTAIQARVSLLDIDPDCIGDGYSLRHWDGAELGLSSEKGGVGVDMCWQGQRGVGQLGR